jgi:hypothetical protein
VVVSAREVVRGAFVKCNNVFFHPFADGLAKMTFRDQNDHDHLQFKFKCPFTGGCRECASLRSDGTCKW